MAGAVMQSKWLLLLLANLPAMAGDLFEDGLAAYRQKRYTEAVRTLESFVKSAPPGDERLAEALAALGLSYFFDERFRAAIPYLERALEMRQSDDATYALGMSRMRLSDGPGARRAFARLLGLQPDSAEASVAAAGLMMRSRMEDLAEAELNRAASLGPPPPNLHYLRGELAIYRGDAERGATELRREIERNPSHASAWYRLGDAYARLNKSDDAISALKKSIWLNPDFSSPFILLGKVYAGRGEHELAAGALERAVAMDANNAAARYLLGSVYRKLGKEQAAQEQFAAFQRLRK